MAEWAVVLVPFIRSCLDTNMFNSILIRVKITIFYNCVLDITEMNQWINHEKEVLAEIAKQYGIEWEQKGTHEEHLDVYNFKKKERKKEVQVLEQEKEYLTVENEGLAVQIAESREDIQLLKESKEQAVRDKKAAEKRAETAEKQLKSLEERRE